MALLWASPTAPHLSELGARSLGTVLRMGPCAAGTKGADGRLIAPQGRARRGAGGAQKGRFLHSVPQGIGTLVLTSSWIVSFNTALRAAKLLPQQPPKPGPRDNCLPRRCSLN